jgi:hypothetical protein
MLDIRKIEQEIIFAVFSAAIVVSLAIWAALLPVEHAAAPTAEADSAEAREPAPAEPVAKSTTPEPNKIADPLTIIASRQLADCKNLAAGQILDCEEQIKALQALDAGSTRLCAKLTGAQNITNCEAEVYFTLALDKSDPTLCAKIKIEGTRQRCAESFANPTEN